LLSGRNAVELVEARDQSILAMLREGSATFASVWSSVPREPGWTDAQQREAVTLALRRLKLKKLVVNVSDTWLLPQ
jgi:hypothetical protein